MTENKLMSQRSILRSLTVPLAIWLTSRLVVLLSWVIYGAIRPGEGIRDAVLKWDGAWYYSIIDQGYSSGTPDGQSNIAFFPGFPLIVRLVDALPGFNSLEAGVFVSTLLSLSAVLGFWLLSQLVLGDREEVSFATAMFAFTPGSVVLSMIYSEGLFLTVAAISLFLILKNQLIAASIFAAIAGFTRPTGVVLVGIIFISAGIEVIRNRNYRTIFALFIAPSGVISYALFLNSHVGSVDSYFQTQRLGWGEKFDLLARFEDLVQLRDWVLDGFGSADWNRVIPGILLLVTVVSLVGCFKLRLPWQIIIFALGIIAFSLSSATLGMRPRFYMSAFPLTFGISYFLRKPLVRILAIGSTTSLLMAYSIIVVGFSYQTP